MCANCVFQLVLCRCTVLPSKLVRYNSCNVITHYANFNRMSFVLGYILLRCLYQLITFSYELPVSPPFVFIKYIGSDEVISFEHCALLCLLYYLSTTLLMHYKSLNGFLRLQFLIVTVFFCLTSGYYYNCVNYLTIVSFNYVCA